MRVLNEREILPSRKETDNQTLFGPNRQKRRKSRFLGSEHRRLWLGP